MQKKEKNISKRRISHLYRHCKQHSKQHASYPSINEKRNYAKKYINNIGHSDSKKNKFKEIASLWLNSNQIRLKGSTKIKYQYMLEKHLFPVLGNKEISALTSSFVNSFLTEKLLKGRLDGSGGLSPAYVKTMSILINAILTFASKEKLCQPLKNPIFKPKVLKKEMQILSEDTQKEFEKIILTNLDLTKLGTYICLHTGLRIGEICALSWSDIDFDARTICIRHTVSRVANDNYGGLKTKLIVSSPKTESSKRTIPIPSVLLPILKKMYCIRKSEFVISDNDNFVSTRTFDVRYRNMLKQAGLEIINFHSLRHTFATRCVDAGVDIKTLSEILGHSSVSITLDTYVHPSIDVKRNQIEKLYKT